MREVQAVVLKPGDVVALPFGKTATVKQVKLGRQYVTVSWKDPFMDSRYRLDQEVSIEERS